MKTFLRKSLLLLLALPFFVSAQNTDVILQQTLNENAKGNNLTTVDVNNWKLVDHHNSRKGRVGFYYVHQAYNDLLLHNAISVIAIKKDKGILTSNGFLDDLASKVETSTANISAEEAILAASKNIGVESVGELSQINTTKEHDFTFQAEELSVEPINVDLKLYQIDSLTVRAVWDLAIYQLNQKHWWSIRVDAHTGEILDKTDWVLNCDFGNREVHEQALDKSHHNQLLPEKTKEMPKGNPTKGSGSGAGYNVFPIPVESPIHGSRQLVIDPADPVASPYEWHDMDGVTGAEFTTTQGNNVFASEDRADADVLGHTPDGGSTLNFDFPLDMNLSPIDYEDAAITNLFYMNNIMHDIWYHYGFDEASGNFQYNNYGNGGLDNDHVDAQAQDGGGMNNANMATGPDGYRPRMQMYLWLSGNSDLLTVNSPTTMSGSYNVKQSTFGPPVPSTPITSNLALYEDNVSDPNDACESAVNASALNGKIVLIKRGGCNFTTKVQNAENAGAVAVIVVNNVSSNPIAMGGTDPGIGIPSVMISKSIGTTMIMQVSSSLAVNVTLVSPGGSDYKDGDFDNGIIAHEYGHGISVRLTGGASYAGCLNNEDQMGEGWSDYFGLMLTMKPGDLGTDSRGIGTFASGQSSTGGGIRPLPYSTDFNVNFITYDYTNNTSSISEPHGIGFIWATMLWDMTWALIDEYGFDPDLYNGTGGNNLAMQLVIDGIKLQGCNPGFVDGRDAILQADQIFNNGANKCLIWRVFANRGLGYSADQGNTDDRSDQVEAFDMPPSLGNPANVDVESSCGAFTWSKNGQTYTSSGLYTTQLSNSPSCDSIATLDLTIEDVQSQIMYGSDGATLVAYSGYDYQWIDCDNGNTPIPGATNSTFTATNNGNYAVIVSTATCSDTSSCLYVGNVGLENETEDEMSIYPNPTQGNVEIEFSEVIDKATVRVMDMTGKLVQEFEVMDTAKTAFFLKGDHGIYMVELVTNAGDIYRKRISKIN